jgi:pimeloyl-ACP methyl ester carboxylesterase
MTPTAAPEKRKRRGPILWSIVLFAVVLAWRPAATHLRAAALLSRFADASSGPTVGRRGLGARTVEEEDVPLVDTRARIYTPRGVRDPPGLVIVHGVHRLGIDEPRLVRFARAIAADGVRVLTPEVRELADYRVDPRSIETIGAAVRELRVRTQAHRTVGLMGMSFAGGLSLLVAADPRFSPDLDFIVSIGGHDDVARVSRFFATDTIPRPDGTILSAHAHEYGPLVLVYSHVEDLFPPQDAQVARDILRMWLWEEQDKARARVDELTPPSRLQMQRLLDHQRGSVRPELLAVVDRHQALMANVSPHGRLGSLHVPVYLLHGAGDLVIPPTETLWLEHDLPARVPRVVLVTPAINHV